MKLNVIRLRTSRKVLVNGKWFANLYRVAKGWGNGQTIKEGEWIINRGPEAIRRGFFFPPVSYPTVKQSVKDIKKALTRRG